MKTVLIVTMILVLSALAAPADAATMRWNGNNSSFFDFGRSIKGAGPSKVRLVTPRSGLAVNGRKVVAEIAYLNRVNRQRCFLFFCKTTPSQKRVFKIFEGTKLVSKGYVYVKPRNGYLPDLFRFTASYVAKGYHWMGAKKKYVKENSIHRMRLIGPKATIISSPPPSPPPPPSPVPLPASLLLLGGSLGGLFGMRRLKKKPA